MARALTILGAVLALLGGVGLYLWVTGEKRGTAVLTESKRSPPSVPVSEKEDAERLWLQRDDPVKLQEAVDAYKKLIAHNPQDVKSYCKLSRLHYWKGFTDSSEGKKQEAYREGLGAGQKALEIDPGDVEANYWTAANMARYSEISWGPRQLAYIPRMRTMLKTVAEKDRNYFYGGIERFQGIALTKLAGDSRGIPLVGGIKEAIEHLEKAVAIGPTYFLNHVALAEAYLKTGQKDRARKELEWVVNTPAGIDPDVAPENRYDQEMAIEMLRREFGKGPL